VVFLAARASCRESRIASGWLFAQDSGNSDSSSFVPATRLDVVCFSTPDPSAVAPLPISSHRTGCAGDGRFPRSPPMLAEPPRGADRHSTSPQDPTGSPRLVRAYSASDASTMSCASRLQGFCGSQNSGFSPRGADPRSNRRHSGWTGSFRNVCVRRRDSCHPVPQRPIGSPLHERTVERERMVAQTSGACRGSTPPNRV